MPYITSPTLRSPIRRVLANDAVAEDQGKSVIERGPLVYCVEQADCPEADVWDLALPGDAEFRLGPTQIEDQKVVALDSEAVASSMDEWQDALYAPFAGGEPNDSRTVPVRAIPYFAWANREAGPMQVWLPMIPGQ